MTIRSRLVFLSALGAMGGSVIACQVPVFRYALERWPPDPHIVVVAHRGEMNEAEKKRVQRMENDSWMCNIEVITVDVTNEDAVAEFPEVGGSDRPYPQMATYYPHGTGLPTPYWQGDFNDANVDKLLESPLRQKLLKMITEGNSAIWLLIESGDKEKDDAEEKRLKEMLATAGDGLQIPDGVLTAEEAEQLLAEQRTVDPKDILQSTIPLQIKFSIVRLSQDEIKGAEGILYRMMMGIDPEALKSLEENPETVIAPIFGRGRMLPGIPASQVDEDAVWAACQYLCGECGCEVKDENPGFDLLLKAEWDEIMDGNYVIVEKELPPLTGTGDLVENENENSAAKSASLPPAESQPSKLGPSPYDLASAQAMKRNVMVFGGIFLVVVAGVTLLVRRQGG